MTVGKTRSAIWLAALLGLTFSAWGKAIYVSPTGNNQNSGSSSSSALATIAAASARAAPGDTVYLMPGTYSEAITPVNSGTASQPITYKAAGPTPPVISNVNVGIMVNSLSYLVFDGINIDGQNQPPKATVNTFLAVQNSNHITVQNVTFRRANGWAGVDISGFYSSNGTYWEDMPKNTPLSGSTSYVTLQDSTFDNVGNFNTPSGDVIQVSYGQVQHILIQRNTITHGGHDLLELDSDYGVAQDNTFNNSYADIIGGDTGYRSIEVRGSYNVIQRNLMEHARVGGGGYYGPIASIRGNQNLVRSNVLYDAINGGIATWCGTATGDDSVVTNGHIYNNTFSTFGGGAWQFAAYTGCTNTGGFVFMNNLVVDTRMTPGMVVQHGAVIQDVDLEFEVDGGSGLVNVGRGPVGQNVIKSNSIVPHSGGAPYVFLVSADGRIPLSTATGKYPSDFSANVSVRPSFVSAQPQVAADFALQPTSFGLGAGAFLTTVQGTGNSNQLVVQDSLFFSDGNGVGAGDIIQLQGSTQQATIVSINRSTNTLTLSSAVAFKDGQGVALPYNASAPDMGSGGAIPVTSIRPLPPGHLGITP
jgi:hypothetical protein